jgi:hypothetical protein
MKTSGLISFVGVLLGVIFFQSGIEAKEPVIINTYAIDKGPYGTI